jgi:hypothetical protein
VIGIVLTTGLVYFFLLFVRLMLLILEDEEEEELASSLGQTSRYGKTRYLLAVIATKFAPKRRDWYIFPRSTHWAEGIFSSDKFIDEQFRATFRMHRSTFWNLHDLLKPYIQKQVTVFRVPIPSERRLAIFLYHIAHGVSYKVVENQFGCGITTVSQIVSEVSKAILKHLTSKYIRFSTPEEAMRTIEHWRSKTGIPGVVGCIDGSHIPIIQPSKFGKSYYNRKGFYTINVQGTNTILTEYVLSCI